MIGAKPAFVVTAWMCDQIIIDQKKEKNAVLT